MKQKCQVLWIDTILEREAPMVKFDLKSKDKDKNDY